MIPVGYAQINYRFTGAAVPTGAEVVIGVLNTLESSANAVAQAALDAWESSNMSGNLVSTCVLSSVLAKLGPDATGASASVGAAEAGSYPAGVSGAVAASALVQKNTELGGRRGRGRMFIPGIPESQIDPGGVLITEYVVPFALILNEFLADLNAANIPMVLLHGPPTEWVLVDGQPRRVPTAGEIPEPTQVESLTLQVVLGTQRRRQRR